jgi:hypothetical protein
MMNMVSPRLSAVGLDVAGASCGLSCICPPSSISPRRIGGGGQSFAIPSWAGNESISRNPNGVLILDSFTAHGAFKAADLARLYDMLAAVINRAAPASSMGFQSPCCSDQIIGARSARSNTGVFSTSPGSAPVGVSSAACRNAPVLASRPSTVSLAWLPESCGRAGTGSSVSTAGGAVAANVDQWVQVWGRSGRHLLVLMVFLSLTQCLLPWTLTAAPTASEAPPRKRRMTT